MTAVEKLLRTVGSQINAGQIAAARRTLARAAAEETALGTLAGMLLEDLDAEIDSAQLSVAELLGENN